MGGNLDGERDDGERGDRVAEAKPVSLEQIGGDKGRGQSAEAEEEIDQVERGGAMVRADGADQRIGAGDHDAPAHAEQKQQKDDAAESLGAGQREERDDDERQAQNEPNLVALRVEQWAHADRGDDETESLGEGDGAVLRRGETEAVGQVGQDGAEHGGNHSVDEDGEDGGKNQHAR